MKEQDDLLEQLEVEEKHINELSLALLADIVESAAESGFDVRSNPATVKDMLLIMEAIAGMMHRSVGDNLPITDISNKLFPYDEDRCEELLQLFIDNSGAFT